MKNHLKIVAFLSVAFAFALPHIVSAQDLDLGNENNRPSFIIPIDCDLGQTCFTQNYVDMNPGRIAQDQECGHLTYDGHKGTDIRIRDLKEMEKGVKVLAAADGIIKGYRDGEHDGLFMNGMETASQGKECGNGVVIDHGNGWVTQYCHMKKGSIYVQRGAQIRAGDRIGEVGLSGRTEFPHLHFAVRHNNAVVNPFTGTKAANGCRNFEESLWKPAVRANTIYIPTEILNMGFASGAVEGQKIELGAYSSITLEADTPALVLFARVFGLQTGDTQSFTILLPDGSEFTSNRTTHDGTPKAQYYKFIGKKRPPTGWPTGVYKGTYRLIRKGQILLNRTIEIEHVDENATRSPWPQPPTYTPSVD